MKILVKHAQKRGSVSPTSAGGPERPYAHSTCCLRRVEPGASIGVSGVHVKTVWEKPQMSLINQIIRFANSPNTLRLTTYD